MDTQSLALLLAGIIWPFLLQLLKRWVPVEGRVAQWVAVVVSFGLAILARGLTGGDLSAEGIISGGATVSVLALVIYRQLIKKPDPAQ